MNLFLSSFWRAVAYCLHPRVVLLSLLPLGLMVALALGSGYFFWDAALAAVRAWLEASSFVNAVWAWLNSVGAGGLKTVLAPLSVIFAVTPLIVVLSLLLVSLLATPALTELVARRRFPQLARQRGASWLVSLAWSLGATLLALLALVISVPMWLVPPLILVLPPLIWGWLTYRVLAFDVLAGFASADERRELLRTHRGWLLGMGVLCGYLGAAPSLLWASGAMFAAAFVVLVPLAVWIYMLVFSLSSLWFAHYCLAALQAQRAQANGLPPTASMGTPVGTPAGTPGSPIVIDVEAVTWRDDANSTSPDTRFLPGSGRPPQP